MLESRNEVIWTGVSLNLSNSVAIAAYEAIRQIDYKELR